MKNDQEEAMQRDYMKDRPENVKVRDIAPVSEEDLIGLGAEKVTGEEGPSVGAVEGGVPEEVVAYDDGVFLRLTHQHKDGHLILHAWRGANVSNSYWGEGLFGTALQNALMEVFPVDTFDVDYVHEMLSYCAVLPNAAMRPIPVPVERARRVGEVMVAHIKSDLAG